ncbi:MAG: uroporphyrinogen decarboxylase family protein [Candidatus Bipolaricaulaceae bacterium]
MGHRERVLQSLHHREPDRVPLDIGSTLSTGIAATTYARLRAHLGLPDRRVRLVDCTQQLAAVGEDVLDHFSADLVPVYRLHDGFGVRLDAWKEGQLVDGTPAWVPAEFSPAWEGGAYKVKRGDLVLGQRSPGALYFEPVFHPLAEAQRCDELREGVARWLPPLSDAEARYLRAQARAARATGRAVVGQFGGNLLETAHWLRGYARFMRDLAARRPLAEYLLDLLVDRHLADLAGYARAVGECIDVIQFGDDFGMQTGPQISPAMYRSVFRPRQRALWTSAKHHGPYQVMLHSCGSIRALLPDMIEAGVDIINPVQLSAKDMDPVDLKREFGRELVFWGGGCDTQRTLPSGSPEDVIQQVRRNIEALAPGGGFVFAPVHNVQPDVPPENVVALYTAARRYGRYPHG